MVALLQQVASGEVQQQPRDSLAQTSAVEGRNADGSVGAVHDRLLELYDAEFGGFGVEPKQPPWEALAFLTACYSRSGDRALLDMVEATLQGMWHGIYDRKGQGFFRYSVSRDWKVPHYEKMLVSNASLARAYVEGYQLTGKAIYRTAVEGILQYLLDTLFSPSDGLFWASQDADEPYYQSSWKDRESSQTPPVDRTLYAGVERAGCPRSAVSGGRAGRCQTPPNRIGCHRKTVAGKLDSGGRVAPPRRGNRRTLRPSC